MSVAANSRAGFDLNFVCETAEDLLCSRTHRMFDAATRPSSAKCIQKMTIVCAYLATNKFQFLPVAVITAHTAWFHG